MAVPKDKDVQRAVSDILINFQGIEPIKKLFWSVLNYNRINEPLSYRGWPDSLKDTVADNPLLLAGGGVDSDFHIIYCRLKSETLSRSRGLERPIVNHILKEHPYNLTIFSNAEQTQWHFLNAKYDPDINKRLLFRRIAVSRGELLRTAAERISMLDLESVSPDLFGIFPLAIQNRCDEAFDVEAVTREFYDKYEVIFQQVESQITGIPDESRKRLFTQLLFNRLMFIAFIQKKGWLLLSEGNPSEYLQKLWEQYQKKTYQNKNFYRDYLKEVFFHGFNDPNKRDTRAIELIGRVPYLNGGLFEVNDDDQDKSVTISDKAAKQIIEDLFSRFNFTVMESTPLDTEVAVDPEMLGKVFEKLVTGRHESGSYYTPKSIVSFMCREALKNYLGGHELLVDEKNTQGVDVSEARKLLSKLSQIKVCDPACGSGAYLVGMLHELHELTRLLDTRADQASARDDYQRKLEIIQNNLYGVDIDSFAVNIARLRMWLSLAVEYEGNDPPPLPNLDFKIETGDSLTAPDPTGSEKLSFRENVIMQFQQKKAEYMKAHVPGEKQALYEEIVSLRKSVIEWTHPGVDVEGFDWAVEFAEVFSDGGFDITMANPPYGIKCEDPLRFQFFPNEKGKGFLSKDSYGLFMARALQLLKPGAFFTFIVSDTWRTIRTHKALRKKLFEETRVFHIIDLPSWVFDATVNTCILSLCKKTTLKDDLIIAGDLTNLPAQRWDLLESNLLAIATHGLDVQTTTYARYTYPQSLIATYDNFSFFIGSPHLYRLMSDKRFMPLGDVAEVKQGLATADNEYYLRKRYGARGSYQLLDEKELLSENEIPKLTENEKRNGVNPAKYGGRHFIPYDKGGASDTEEGWLPNYYVPTEYFIDWSCEAIHRLRTATIADVKRRKGEEKKIKTGDRTRIASRFQNFDFYFREGITFSWAGAYSPTFRHSSPTPFDHGSSCIFSDKISRDRMLAICCSTLSKYIIRNFINHTVNFGIDDVKEIRVFAEDSVIYEDMEKLVKQIVRMQESNPRYLFHSKEQKGIDTLISELYGLTKDDMREVELWYCRRYPKLAEAQGVLQQVQEKYADHLAGCENIISKPPGYWKSHSILQLIAHGESQNLEFKETLEADVKAGGKNPGLLISTLKTICAFLNSSGGTLLIGVSDKGEIVGLERDILLCGKHNLDGFELKLRSLIKDRISPDPLGKVTIQFENLPEGTVCCVNANSHDEIIHLDGKDVYMRDGNMTRKLEGAILTSWIKERVKH